MFKNTKCLWYSLNIYLVTEKVFSYISVSFKGVTDFICIWGSCRHSTCKWRPYQISQLTYFKPCTLELYTVCTFVHGWNWTLLQHQNLIVPLFAAKFIVKFGKLLQDAICINNLVAFLENVIYHNSCFTIAEIVIFSGYIKYKMSDDSGDEGFFNENFDEERLTILF